MTTDTQTIARLNDQFRTSGRGGLVVTTPGIHAVTEAERVEVFAQVSAFEAFTPGNDPYGEHDLGAFTVNGHEVLWKIDYYADSALEYGSADPADPAQTVRVLTIMLAAEY